MRTHALPSDETARIDALMRARILDSPPETAFDDLVQLAASLCDAPLAVITFIDRDRQWFKARVGVEVAQTPRSSGLCSHTIESGEPCVVEDAQADPRFSSHLLVAADPQVRFYCGVPVVTTDGYAIGTIAVMDRVARPWRETECLALQRLARQAAALLELPDAAGVNRLSVRSRYKTRRCFSSWQGVAGPLGWIFSRSSSTRWRTRSARPTRSVFVPFPGRRAKTVAGYGPDGPLDTMEYDLVGTPYEHVLRRLLSLPGRRASRVFPRMTCFDGSPSSHTWPWRFLRRPVSPSAGLPCWRTPLVDAGRASRCCGWLPVAPAVSWGGISPSSSSGRAKSGSRAAYRNATVGMSIADESGRIEEVNQQLCTILGYSEEELLTRTFQSLTHPDDLGQNLERIKNLMEGTAEGDVFEKRYIRKDGEIVWAQVGLSVIRDAAGRVRHTLAMVQDITERKRTKEALYLAKYTIDHATEAIYWVGAGAELLDVNDAACDMLGYTKDEFRRMTVHDINPEFEADRWPSFWADMRRRGRDSFESLHRAKDGRLIPIEVSVMFIQYNQVECHCAFVRDISERKQAEQALAHTQEKLRQALRASGTGLWDWNTETNEVFFSDEWAQQLGHTNQEIAGRFEEWESRLHPDDRERALVYVQHYLTNPKGPYEQEFRLRRKDGSYCWISARASFVEEPDGRRVRLLGSHTDLTERKLAETALRASEERFHITIEAINEGMWDWNILTDVVYFSPQWIRLLGYVPEAVTGSAAFFYSILHPDDLPRMREVLQAHLDGRTPLKELEVRLHHKSGEYRWYLDRGKVVARDEQGRPLRMVGTITDITERKQVERERAEALGNLQTIMETVPDVIFVLDLEGRLSKWNRRLETVTGYTHDELLGKPALEMVPSAEAEQTRAAIRLAFDNGYAELEGHLLTKDGRALALHWNGTPFEDLQGQVVGITGVGRDIPANDSRQRPCSGPAKSGFVSWRRPPTTFCGIGIC
ncbi:MAG: PAS domain S-box protein [Nitrospira sp.]|nr:PAS domain S-box protein [Nitrospira sp.]